MIIYHITTAEAWREAVNRGVYRAPSLDREGFIHCSTGSQVDKIVNAFYQNVTDLVILSVDTEKLFSKVVWEPPAHPGGDIIPAVEEGETFPHVYGEINLEAVVSAGDQLAVSG